MDFNTLCTNWKRNKYSTLRFTNLMVPHRLWRHNCVTSHVMNVLAASANCLERTRTADHWQCCRPMERSFGSLYAWRGWTFWAHTLKQFTWTRWWRWALKYTDSWFQNVLLYVCFFKFSTVWEKDTIEIWVHIETTNCMPVCSFMPRMPVLGPLVSLVDFRIVKFSALPCSVLVHCIVSAACTVVEVELFRSDHYWLCSWPSLYISLLILFFNFFIPLVVKIAMVKN